MMALASRPRASLNDENSHPAVKVQPLGGQATIGRSGLKQQQVQQQQQQLTSTINERRILSDISNSSKSRPSLGTPKPSPRAPGLAVFRGENIPPKGAVLLPPQSSSQKQQQPAARVPLRHILNESQPLPSVPSGKKLLIQKKKAASQVKLTAEQLRQAEEWAKEDRPVEHVHFTGQDMDALRERMMEAEIDETVTMVRDPVAAWSSSFNKPAMDDMDPSYFEDGRLKPDLCSSPFDDDMNDLMDIVPGLDRIMSLVEDDVSSLISRSNSAFDDYQYPRIPENWHIVRDDGPTTLAD